MSTGYDERAALNQGLWEQLDARVANISERIDKLMMGEEAYDYSQKVSAEVRQIEHERDLELYKLAVKLSQKNRGKR